MLVSGVYGGQGPGLLLLHGFAESHRIWHAVSDQLAKKYSVIAMDLRGYGDSSKPKSDACHSTYSKRAMAKDCVAVMKHLGHEKFYFIGHDRGARVGHRLCVDYPEKVIKAIFLDICPTLSMYETTDLKFATLYYHWFFLIQDYPYPESLIIANPHLFIVSHMGGRYAGLGPFKQQDIQAYTQAISTMEGAHAMCEDYRASATIDLDHARQDIANGIKMKTPLKVLCGKHGVIGKCFDAIQLWQDVATDVCGAQIESGHYIPEEAPAVLLEHINRFF